MQNDEAGFRGVSLRLTETEIAELDEIATELTERAAGAKVSRASAAMAAYRKGLDSIRRELAKK